MSSVTRFILLYSIVLELLNQEHTRGEELEADVIEGPVDIVSVEEVREAIQRMKMGRAADQVECQ